MSRARTVLVWSALAIVIAIPLMAAAASPLLAYRDPTYIAAGFAGIAAMVLLLVQPLLVGGYLPGLSAMGRRRAHRWIGVFLIAATVAHVLGLWITSPPDVVDALLFASPTPFSAWGVIAMWAIFAAALLAARRRSLRWHPRKWRLGHTTLAAAAIVGSVVHALLIEGSMETVSKYALCTLVLIGAIRVLFDLRVWEIR